MILEQLVLHNVGPFLGRQEIALRPRSAKKPIVLFGGLNGAGKTTILEALQIALYGKNADPAVASKRPYEEYLASLTHRSVDPTEGSAIELEFESLQSGSRQQFRVCRYWSRPGPRLRESLDVWVDGRLDSALAESWDEQVYRFLPPGLSHLFFFDGERIEGLADPEESGQLIRIAIEALLGVDVIRQLDADLNLLSRRKLQAELDGPAANLLTDEDARVDAAEEVVKDLRQEKAAMRTALDRLAEQLRRAQRNYEDVGGAVAEKRLELEREIAALRKEEELHRAELRDLAAGDLPLALVRPNLLRIRRAALRESSAAEARVLIGTLESRDTQLLGALEAAGATSSILERADGFLRDDRGQRASEAEHAVVFELSEQARLSLLKLLDKDLKNSTTRAATTAAKLEAVQTRIDAVESLLGQVPDQESIAEAETQLRVLTSSQRSSELELEKLDERLRLAEAQHAEQIAKREQLHKERAKADLHNDAVRRFVEHANLGRTILNRFRTEVTSRHISRLETLIMEGYSELLRKNGLVSSIEIAPETYRVQLRNSQGHIIDADSLSAGERQLLAVSLLWGLGRASGRPLPVIIDTPLGRLDSEHRRNLTQRYFPNASHQILLLSTDEEIEGELYERLRPSVSLEYRLDYDDATDATAVLEGYFEEV